MKGVNIRAKCTAYDVVVIGGGLAGLGLAKQLIKAEPTLSILVVERERFPRPKAIAKVGESTVEIGSHYLAHHLELADALQHNHLKKFGIRMFFGQDTADFAQQDELGASQSFGIPTYQIDRGDIENTLAASIEAAGVELLQCTSIDSLDLSGNQKQLTLKGPDGLKVVKANWCLDASGRAALIKRTQGLAQSNSHKSNAIWFRVDCRVEIDAWSTNTDWRERCSPQGARWLSTNHLVGPGYWVWIIPLACGVTSIGIVMDDAAFKQAQIIDEPSARRWLRLNQRRCAQAIEEANFLDFVVLPDYSYGCKRLWDASGWAITGEAGVFADPFYSPGSDFIAIANTMITQLVSDNVQGKNTQLNAMVSERVFRSVYDSTLSLYVGQYGGFGDRRMMSLKLLWDYSYYWGVLSLLFFRDTLHNMPLMRELSSHLMLAQTLNQTLQAAFSARAQKRLVLPAVGIFMDQYKIPCLQHFNQVLMAQPDKPVGQELAENNSILQRIAVAVIDMLDDEAGANISDTEREILGDYRKSVVL